MKVVKVPWGTSFAHRLVQLLACGPARVWVGKKSLKTAWRQCERPDWMMWLATEVPVPKKSVRKAAVRCAHLVLPYVEDDEVRAALKLAKKSLRKRVEDDLFYRTVGGALEATHKYRYVDDRAQACETAYWALRMFRLSPAHAFVVTENLVDIDGGALRVPACEIIREEIPYEVVQAAIRKEFEKW